MTQMPQDYGYQPYTPNYSGLMPGLRPGTVTTPAIIGIILGGLGLLCTGYQTAMSFVTASHGGRNPLAPTVPPTDPRIMTWTLIAAVVNLCFCVVLLVTCILALKLQPMARRVLLGWSVATIAWEIASTILVILWIVPVTEANLKKVMAANPMASSIGTMVTGATLVQALIICILPICFLILWTRPQVKEAFAAGPIP